MQSCVASRFPMAQLPRYLPKLLARELPENTPVQCGSEFAAWDVRRRGFGVLYWTPLVGARKWRPQGAGA